MITFKQLLEYISYSAAKPRKEDGARHTIIKTSDRTIALRKYDDETGDSDDEGGESKPAPVKRGRGRPPGKYGTYKKKVKEAIEVLESLETDEEIDAFIDTLDEETIDEIEDILTEGKKTPVDKEAIHKEIMADATDDDHWKGYVSLSSPHAKPEHAQAWLDKHGEKLKNLDRGIYIKDIKRRLKRLKDKEILANAKNVKEDVDQIDEISKKTLGSYVKKAGFSLGTNTSMATASSMLSRPKKETEKFNRTAYNRMKGINRVADRLTKEDVNTDAQD